MIIGIGTDIVCIGRIQQVMGRHGERFACRVLAPAELQEYYRSPRPAAFLAKRFAVKEAVSKAFGTGMRGLAWCEVAVEHERRGRPTVRYLGRAVGLARRRGICASHVSIADESDYAVAFVVLEGGSTVGSSA